MKRGALAALVLLAACSPKSGQADEVAPAVSPFTTEKLVIFPESRGLELLNQCSRGTPGPIETTWTPSAQDVAQLESRLLPYLRDQRPAAYPEGKTPDLIRRYAGYVIKGRRVIYLDAAVPESLGYSVTETYELPDKPYNSVCDGGPSFFGVEYDVKAKTFSNLLENGPY